MVWHRQRWLAESWLRTSPFSMARPFAQGNFDRSTCELAGEASLTAFQASLKTRKKSLTENPIVLLC